MLTCPIGARFYYNGYHHDETTNGLNSYHACAECTNDSVGVDV